MSYLKPIPDNGKDFTAPRPTLFQQLRHPANITLVIANAFVAGFVLTGHVDHAASLIAGLCFGYGAFRR